MKKTPAQLKSMQKYYNQKIESGYVQFNVLIKKELITALKQYAIKKGVSIQKALDQILKDSIIQSNLNQEKLDPWTFTSIFKKKDHK